MSSEFWMDLLRRTGALQSGHFQLSSGLHSAQYVQCARALEQPRDAAALGEELASRLAPARVDRVVSPPLGALLIGYEVARHLGCRFAFPERTATGRLRLRRGFAIRPGERIAVVEDVITTGGTTREVIALVGDLGGDVVGVGAIVDRSAEGTVAGLPIESIVTLSIPTYTPAACPLCEAGERLTSPGSRAEA